MRIAVDPCLSCTFLVIILPCPCLSSIPCLFITFCHSISFWASLLLSLSFNGHNQFVHSIFGFLGFNECPVLVYYSSYMVWQFLSTRSLCNYALHFDTEQILSCAQHSASWMPGITNYPGTPLNECSGTDALVLSFSQDFYLCLWPAISFEAKVHLFVLCTGISCRLRDSLFLLSFARRYPLIAMLFLWTHARVILSFSR